jgi:hypothetical protein
MLRPRQEGGHQERASKLLAAGFIKVYHPEWLANPVLVLKNNNNEWRMCVDYTNINKHCPKDPFALPRIDQVIDSTAGCVLLFFLNCYSGYHQIALKEEDQVKKVFITPFGAYAYTTMSIGLKNAGATYQRPSNCALQTSYTAVLKLTWMMWSSRPDPMMSSLRISRRYSIACGSFYGSLT